MKLLVKNELIKITKQTGFRVIFIIFACLIAVTPLLGRAANALGSLFSSGDFEQDAEYFSTSAEECRSNGDWSGWIYHRAAYEMRAFYIENGLSNKDAEYEIYSNELENAYAVRSALSLLKDGTYGSWERLADDDYWNISYRVKELMSKLGIDANDGSGSTEQAEEDAVSKESLEALASALPPHISSIEKRIKEFAIESYYADNIKEFETYRAAAKARADSAEAAYESSSEKERGQFKYDYEYTKSELESADTQLWALRYLADHASPYRGWEYQTAIGIICRAAMSMPGYTDLDRETYEKDPEIKNYITGAPMSYEEYVESNQKNRDDAAQAVAIAKYSLEHKTPLPSTLDFSGRVNWQTQINSVLSWGTIIAIVLAGTTLSSEYSSGTIRLLLIRPKKRYKILLSKIFAIGTVWGCMAIAAYAVLFLVNLAFAPGDMFVSDLIWIGGKAVEINPMLHTAVIMLEDMLSASVFVSFALLLSSLMRKAALPIALPIIAMQISSTIQFTMISLQEVLGKWIVYSPFPYSDLSVYRTNAAADYITGSDIIGSIVGQMFPYSTVRDFSIPVGICWLAAFLALWTALTFLSFSRQQIKN